MKNEKSIHLDKSLHDALDDFLYLNKDRYKTKKNIVETAVKLFLSSEGVI